MTSVTYLPPYQMIEPSLQAVHAHTWLLFIYLFICLLHGLYRTLSHSQSEESQVRGGHKSVSENPAVKFSF